MRSYPACRGLLRTRALLTAAGFLALTPAPLFTQSALGHPPNLSGEWSLERWQPGFLFGHRFEFISGGDELINLPTLTLGMGLTRRIAIGLDYASNSEIVPGKLGGNETQLWLRAGVVRQAPLRLEALLGHNTAAGSADGALTGTVRFGPLSLVAEGRAFSDVLGTGNAGTAAAGGAVLHLTRFLELSGDVGRMLDPDTLSSVWSAGIAIALPGTRHTFSLHATNGGATTLQGTSRPKVLGREPVRYGFVFTAPLGSRWQWGQVFRRVADVQQAITEDTAASRVEIRMLAFTPKEVRVRAGDVVEWINRDPLEHTVTAADGSWGSALLKEGQRFRRAFAQPGRYPYRCTPHPEMTGVVIVEGSAATP